MKKIDIKKLKPGMVLARPVTCRRSYQILLNAGTVLNEKYIKLLEKFEIFDLYVGEFEEQFSKEQVLFRQLEEITSDKIIKDIYISIYNAYNELANDIRLGNSFNIDSMTKDIEKVIYAISSKKNILIQLTILKDNDPAAYTHCINVAIFSLSLGKALGYSNSRLLDLGLGAILHDIGKLRIPENILYKPARLTDDEFSVIKSHPMEGYSILVSQKIGNPVIWSIVRDHHERCDGSGYPNALHCEEIISEARLVSIADVYEATTTDRCYRPKMQPHEGAELLMGYSSLNNLDPNYVQKFLATVSIYPVGAMVELSNGDVGKVVEVYPQVPMRPRIQIIDINNNKLYSSEIVDLLFNPTIFIKKIVS